MTQIPPDIRSQIVSLRAAGWTVTAVSEKTGASNSTIKRLCRRHKIKPGEDEEALITAARKELVAGYTDPETIRAIYGALVNDTLAHVALGREKAAEAVAMLMPSDVKSAALVLRGLAAYSTTIKNGADTVRSLIPAPQTAPDELPILQVMTLTEEDIAEMRKDQRRQDAILNGDEIEDDVIEVELGETDVVEPSPN